MQTLHYSTEFITPQAAQEMLAHNTMNRPANKTQVEFYADTMKRGEWELNGETIKFAKDGTLLDGQHRLMAVVKANIPAPFVVVRGLDKEVFKTMDVGKKRTDGDILNVAGVRNGNLVAAIIRRVAVLRDTQRQVVGNTKFHGTGASTHFFLTGKRALEEYNKDKGGYEKARSVGAKYGGKLRILPESEIGALFYHLSFTLAHGELFVYTFLDTLFGVDCANKMVVTLREMLTQDAITRAAHGAAMSGVQRSQAIVRVWNAYVQGKKRVNMKWQNGDKIETFK